MPSERELEKLAGQLENSNDYIVLRKIKNRKGKLLDIKGVPKRGVFVDVETTGLKSEVDEIIELAMLPFFYLDSGEIIEVNEAFLSLRQPSISIPSEITKITGITDEMVKGKFISDSEVNMFLQHIDLVISHNAAFDRPFLEKFNPIFINMPWSCSMTQIPWNKNGIKYKNLDYILYKIGLFYDAHRAINDCNAGLETLIFKFPDSNTSGLTYILNQNNTDSFLICVTDAPYKYNTLLKERSYRWKKNLKSWCKEIYEEEVENEIQFLQEEIFQNRVDIPIKKIDPYIRFSDRI